MNIKMNEEYIYDIIYKQINLKKIKSIQILLFYFFK
jgi:hypothetical protein